MNDLADLYQQINKRFFEDYSLCGYDNRGTLEAIVSNGKKLFLLGKMQMECWILMVSI